MVFFIHTTLVLWATLRISLLSQDLTGSTYRSYTHKDDPLLKCYIQTHDATLIYMFTV